MNFQDYTVNEMDEKTAMIAVDLQNDFGHKKGTLYVNGADELPDIISYLPYYFSNGFVFWTKDFHPANHSSFKENGGIWPVHCVQHKWGSNFMNRLDIDLTSDHVIYKGMDQNVDSYSAFFDNNREKQTELKASLDKLGVTSLFVVGLATDYCVKYTVLDALSLGYKVAVYLPGCRGVELNEGDVAKAIEEMKNAGAIILEG